MKSLAKVRVATKLNRSLILLEPLSLKWSLLKLTLELTTPSEWNLSSLRHQQRLWSQVIRGITEVYVIEYSPADEEWEMSEGQLKGRLSKHELLRNFTTLAFYGHRRWPAVSKQGWERKKAEWLSNSTLKKAGFGWLMRFLNGHNSSGYENEVFPSEAPLTDQDLIDEGHRARYLGCQRLKGD